jgi:protoheme IX farnesyltransferase
VAAEPVVAPRPSVLVDYFELTKPRVMVLLLITMVGAMVWAEGGLPPLWLLGAALLGMGLTSGGASAINPALEPDLDIRMERTKERPVAAGRVEPRPAIAFGIVLTISGVLVLTFLTGQPLAAVMALAGNLFYVLIYTLILKRSTPQNIVIGGAAGALPPVIGWAAVTGDISLVPILLFALVFYWTPPHFWALALRIGPDYAAAGVPMLPVTAGAAETARQIWLYTILLVTISLTLWAVAGMGLVYLAVAVVGGAIFLLRAWRLRSDVLGDGLLRGATRLYRYSISYLTLIFAAIAIDSILPR